MISIQFLVKRLGIFLVVFLGLSTLFVMPEMRKAHDVAFCNLIEPIHNTLNPNIKASFNQETRTDRMHFGIGISLFDVGKRGSQAGSSYFRKHNNPDIIKYPNLHPMILVPCLLLLSLIVVSPINWKTKIIGSIGGLSLFYLVITFFFSHAFAMSYLRGADLPLDSFWHVLITPFGASNSELIYVYVLFIWATITVPFILRRYKGQMAWVIS